MTPRRRFSTLNELANKSPNNPLAGIKRAERINSSLLSKDVESESVENISPDLGDIVAGRIISVNPVSTSSEPTESGFTGAFHSGSGEVFPEGNVIIGGVEAGVLNAGITDEGRLIINSVTLNGTELDAGITRTEAGWITQQTVTVGSETRVMRMGMESNGTEAEGVIEYNQPGSSVTIPNGDFASLDMTDWTQTVGTWTAAAGWAVCNGASSQAPEITNAARFAVTAGSIYNFHVNTAASFNDPAGTFIGTITIQVKFYTAITGGSLVSTETVGTRSGHSLGWAAIERNITVPATATHAVFIAKASASDNTNLQFDDFTVVESTTSRLTMRDGGLFYTPIGGTEFEIEKPLEYLVPKTANESFGTTTPTNVTDMLFTVAANTIYWFDLTLKITTTTAGGTMDARVSFTLPSGAVIAWGSKAGSVSDMEVVGSAFAPNTVSTGALTIGLDSNATSILRFGGFITTSSTAGTVQLQARQDTSNANTFQIDKASFIRYTDLSGANLTSPAYYTNAEAQDAVGTILLDTSTIDFVYTPNVSIEASVKDGSITEAKLEMPTAADTAKVIGWTGTVLDWVSLAASYISDFAATVRATVLTGLSLADSTDVVASDTVLQAVGKLQAQSDAIPAATITLTNKRITKRPSTFASASSLTPNIANIDQYSITALAADLTINAPTGSPSAADDLVFRIKDDGTARLLTWNAIFRAVGCTIPTTTTINKVTYVFARYNNTETKWDVWRAVTQDETVGGDISGTGVVGQLAEFVTNTKTLQAAKIIAPPTHILTLTTTAASTLALNITAAKTLTLTAADNYTLTIPATGTAALLGTANVFTRQQFIDGSSDETVLRLQAHSTMGATSYLQTWETSTGTLAAYINATGALYASRGTPVTNFFAGGAGNTTATGGYNVALGNSAGSLISSGEANFALGREALLGVSTTSYNVAIGQQAMKVGAQEDSVGIGDKAAQSAVLYQSVMIGKAAAGEYSATPKTGVAAHVGIGYSALYKIGTSTANVAIGYQSGYNLSTGSRNIFIGSNSAYRQTTLSDLLIIDNRARADVATEITNAILYGVMAASPTSQSLRVNAYTSLSTIKSGATQAAAGAAAHEVWKTSGHATLPDNVLMIGV